jgi:hypothetical protein
MDSREPQPCREVTDGCGSSLAVCRVAQGSVKSGRSEREREREHGSDRPGCRGSMALRGRRGARVGDVLCHQGRPVLLYSPKIIQLLEGRGVGSGGAGTDTDKGSMCCRSMLDGIRPVLLLPCPANAPDSATCWLVRLAPSGSTANCPPPVPLPVPLPAVRRSAVLRPNPSPNFFLGERSTVQQQQQQQQQQQ